MEDEVDILVKESSPKSGYGLHRGSKIPEANYRIIDLVSARMMPHRCEIQSGDPGLPLSRLCLSLVLS